MKSVDLERAFYKRFYDVVASNPLEAGTTKGGTVVNRPLRIDKPGEFFDPQELPKWWLEPRLVRTVHPRESRLGEEADFVFIRIRAFVKTQPKGGREVDDAPSLAFPIDLARLAVDPSAGAPDIRILDSNGDTVGTLQFQEVRIERAFGVSEVIKGTPIAGLDIATIEVDALASGGTC